MIITAKVLAISFGLALTAFGIATIVLAVQKSLLESDLQEAREKLDYLEDQLQNTSTSSSIPPISSTSETPPPEDINYRLPETLRPTHYDLYLHPDVESGDFSGQVAITISVVEATNVITLHSHNLNIHNVYTLDFGTPAVQSYTLDAVREFLVIRLESTLVKGRNFRLGIIFGGRMENKIVGLYSSSYLKEDQTLKTIASSKFEPTYARQAFPCFDEPAMKATFAISLLRPSGDDYHALSNMNIELEQPMGKYTEVHFNQSVPMSTYLACFIISDFAHKSKPVDTHGIGENFSIRAFATPAQVDKVEFALSTAVEVIEFYIQYFEIAYPLPKLDMAAIPDFVSGAMEHWGLVTYRETALLYDKTVSSTVNRQRVATVVAHELAHMWFGNLVTMKWWNDLWLNEGFARYMEYKAINEVYKDWSMPEQFLIGALQPVLKTDATLATHPIIQTVENPDQITEIFDSITYEKGASIIRMMEDFVDVGVDGGGRFQEAVTNYLKKFAYKNAVTDDLLNEIDALGFEFDIKLIMRTWTEQKGFPVVQVEQISANRYRFTQKPFLANPDDYDRLDYNETEFGYKWSIPITFTTSESPIRVQTSWLHVDQKEQTATLPKEAKWIKVNKNQIGYYRVNYDLSIWANLIEELTQGSGKLSIADRAHLLNDAFSLADATQLPYETALNLTTYLEQEKDFVPWSVAASKLTSLKTSLFYTDAYRDYITYARKLIEKIYKDVTWTVGEEHVKNRLRMTILSAACALGLDDCLSEASTRFHHWLASPDNRPNPDLREIVYYYGMRSGNERSWDAMWELFIAEQDAAEKAKLMYGLSSIQEPWILNRYIDLAWNESFVRGQDYFTCLQNIAENPVGENLVWDYVRENWEKLVDRFGLNERYLGRMIPSITGRFATQTKLEEIEQFFAKYPDAGAGTAARKQALENVKNNIKWLEVNKDDIAKWLKDTQQLGVF